MGSIAVDISRENQKFGTKFAAAAKKNFRCLKKSKACSVQSSGQTSHTVIKSCYLGTWFFYPRSRGCFVRTGLLLSRLEKSPNCNNLTSDASLVGNYKLQGILMLIGDIKSKKDWNIQNCNLTKRKKVIALHCWKYFSPSANFRMTAP